MLVFYRKLDKIAHVLSDFNSFFYSILGKYLLLRGGDIEIFFNRATMPISPNDYIIISRIFLNTGQFQKGSTGTYSIEHLQYLIAFRFLLHISSRLSI